MSSRKSKAKTLSDKIADTFTPKSLIDPDNNSDDDETRAKLVNIDSDDSDYEKSTKPKQLSDFRKRNIKLLSEQNDKYKGTLSTRKEIENDDYYESSNSSDDDIGKKFPSTSDNLVEDSDEEESDSDEAEDHDLETYRKKLKNCQIKDESKDESFSTDDDIDCTKNDNNEISDNDSDYGSSDDEIAHKNENDATLSEQNLLTESNRMEEIEKGLAVQNQLKLWEKLLEVRIHSQKILLKANSLPQPEQYQKLNENEEFLKVNKESTENVQILLDKMLEMQTILMKQYTETKDLMKSSVRKRSATNLDMEGPPNKRIGNMLDENFNNFRPYCNNVLQKWHDRTQILTPGAGNKNKSQSDNYDIVQKIETVLLNKTDLIKKSQIIKGNYQLFGEKIKNIDEIDEINDESIKICTNIYDDTDFYHQQLRELIEYKTNVSANPNEITKQFAELQKLRQKMKKKVDTRASKGRKIRYVVHNKLVNFMASDGNTDWTDESKNELFRSLFTE